jgi:hypothetical protein
MPYDIVKRGTKYCVVKRDGGKRLGCHATRAEAVRQLRAVMASEHKHHQTAIFEVDGARHMLLVSTNGYKDREGEYVSAHAVAKDIDRQWDDSGFHGDNVVLFWHAGPAIGDIIWANQEGPFTVEVARERTSGLPLVQAYTKAIWNYLEAPEVPYGASIGFGYISDDREPDPDGPVYRSIRKFETSVLPLKYAANPYTFAGVIPTMSKERDKELEKITGLAALLEPIRRILSGTSEALADEGKEHKALTGTTPLTREDVLDVVVLTVKSALNEAVETAAKAEGETVAPIDLRTLAGVALDEYMSVPTVDLQTAADILAVEDETAPVAEAEAPTEAEAATSDEATDKALKAVTDLNKQIMGDQAEIVKALSAVIPALSGLARVVDAFKSVDARLANIETEFTQRPRASANADTVVDLPPAVLKAMTEQERAGDSFLPPPNAARA